MAGFRGACVIEGKGNEVANAETIRKRLEMQAVSGQRPSVRT